MLSFYRKISLLIVSLVVCVSAFSQAGGGIYQILDLQLDSRSMALGGLNVSTADGDLNLAISNPALLSDSAHNTISFSYANYLTSANFGSAGYAHSWGDHSFAAAFSFIDFGKFAGYDELDVYQGDFRAKDMVLSLIYSYKFGKYFTVGTSLKPIYSAYERYWSAGLAVDFGANYYNEDILLDLGLAVKSIGFQFNSYSDVVGDRSREALPLNIVFGLSKRLKQAPIRFSMTLHNLQKFNLNYEQAKYGDSHYLSQSKPKWYDMMFRHTIFAVEVLPSKNFWFSAAFNYRRRAEMTIPAFRSLAGFSFGAGFRVKGFRTDLALSQLQTGNLTYHVTITTDLKSFGVR